MREGLKKSFGWVGVSQGGGWVSVPKMFLNFSARRGEGEFLYSSCRHVSHFMDVFTFPKVDKNCSHPMNQVVEICFSANVKKHIYLKWWQIWERSKSYPKYVSLSSRRKTIWGSIKLVLLRWNGDVRNKVYKEWFAKTPFMYIWCPKYVLWHKCKDKDLKWWQIWYGTSKKLEARKEWYVKTPWWIRRICYDTVLPFIMRNIRRNISIDNCNLFVTSHRMYTLYICSCTSNVCADSNIQMSVAHAQNVKYTKCMRWLFNPSKERCWTHAKDVFTYKFLQSYVRRYTCGEQTRQKKYWGARAKCTYIHVHICTYVHTRVETEKT